MLLKELELQLPTDSNWEVKDLGYIQLDSPERGAGNSKRIRVAFLGT